eukprot:6468250-Amphidinium_carterae.1
MQNTTTKKQANAGLGTVVHGVWVGRLHSRVPRFRVALKATIKGEQGYAAKVSPTSWYFIYWDVSGGPSSYYWYYYHPSHYTTLLIILICLSHLSSSGPLMSGTLTTQAQLRIDTSFKTSSLQSTCPVDSNEVPKTVHHKALWFMLGRN